MSRNVVHLLRCVGRASLKFAGCGCGSLGSRVRTRARSRESNPTLDILVARQPGICLRPGLRRHAATFVGSHGQRQITGEVGKLRGSLLTEETGKFNSAGRV